MRYSYKNGFFTQLGRGKTSFVSMTFIIKTSEHLKFEMKLFKLHSFQIILILLMSQSFSAYSGQLHLRTYAEIYQKSWGKNYK